MAIVELTAPADRDRTAPLRPAEWTSFPIACLRCITADKSWTWYWARLAELDCNHLHLLGLTAKTSYGPLLTTSLLGPLQAVTLGPV